MLCSIRPVGMMMTSQGQRFSEEYNNWKQLEFWARISGVEGRRSSTGTVNWKNGLKKLATRLRFVGRVDWSSSTSRVEFVSREGERWRAPIVDRGAPIVNRRAPIGDRSAPIGDRSAPIGSRSAPTGGLTMPFSSVIGDTRWRWRRLQWRRS